MCLLQTIQKNTFHLQQKVATRPIKVLKIGYFSYENNWFVSPVFPRNYKRGIQYNQHLPRPYVAKVFEAPDMENVYTEIGFHSYRFLPSLTQYRLANWGWITADKDNKILADVIAIFEIPTGSIYYSDGENHYVSDSIIFRKAIFNLEEWEAENFQPEKVL